MTNWEDKTKAFLHDPPSKALNIPGHKTMSERLSEVWYVGSGGDEVYDQISASADRPGLPGHKEGCSVDFGGSPELTHPISKGRLHLKLNSLDVSAIENAMIDMLAEMPLNEDIPDKSKFFTIFEGLKQNLSAHEASLYHVWNKIPADTRTPDHSIWHHCALVSALAACKGEPYFFVFSLGPVQGFISEARKLRDLWVGSMILSYLAWAGIQVICDTFGPDHIVYPSLSGQPFFAGWLRESRLADIREIPEEKMRTIASFPNKFVALLPKEAVQTTGREIEDTIRKEWKMICDSVYSAVSQWAGSNPEYFRTIWERQNSGLWEFYWVASPWMGTLGDKLAAELSDEDRARIESLGKLFKQSSGFSTNRGLIYSGSHELAQGLHAALKNSRQFGSTSGEPGDKCTQCGKRQQVSISEYRDKTRAFWESVKKGSGQDIKENERLCSVCLIKRAIYKGRNPLPSQLTGVFEAFKFPSSTEMAFSPILRRLESRGKTHIWRSFVENCGGEEEAYDMLHDHDDDDHPDSRIRSFHKELREEAGIPITNVFGKYYAILLMDGDKMGDLVSGKASSLATWQDIMHSSLPDKLERSLDPGKARGWLENHMLQQKRHLTPSIHKAISEALGDFALNTVPYAVERKHHGRLIYAGGDDVLAVMPVDKVLEAAQQIMELYRTPFVVRKADGSVEPCDEVYQPKNGEKLLIHLGEASTISSAVVIAHHKAPLRGVITEAHRILKTEAKGKAGRDALAISLRKRGGAERMVAHKWAHVDNESYVALLLNLAKDLSDDKTSSQLMYKIDQNRVALETLVASGPEGSVEKLLESLIEKGQRDKSKNAEESAKSRIEQASRLRAILIGKENTVNTDGLLIARFLAQTVGGE
jgi:CRISPR-associated protein Cmr2